MPTLGAKGDQQRMEDFISAINLIKLRLEAKHGPGIRKKWLKENDNK